MPSANPTLSSKAYQKALVAMAETSVASIEVIHQAMPAFTGNGSLPSDQFIPKYFKELTFIHLVFIMFNFCGPNDTLPAYEESQRTLRGRVGADLAEFMRTKSRVAAAISEKNTSKASQSNTANERNQSDFDLTKIEKRG